MRTAKFRPRHLKKIRPREQDTTMPMHCAKLVQKRSIARTVFMHGRPLFCAGIVNHGQGIGELWSKVDILGTKYPRKVLVEQARMLNFYRKKYGFTCLYAWISPTWPSAQHFIEKLGFKRWLLTADEKYYVYRRYYNG